MSPLQRSFRQNIHDKQDVACSFDHVLARNFMSILLILSKLTPPSTLLPQRRKEIEIKTWHWRSGLETCHRSKNPFDRIYMMNRMSSPFRSWPRAKYHVHPVDPVKINATFSFRHLQPSSRKSAKKLKRGSGVFSPWHEAYEPSKTQWANWSDLPRFLFRFV